MAPSIYEYRSAAEWEQAMREWCAENEPYWKLVYYDWDAMEVKTQRFDNEMAARAALDRELANWWKMDTCFHRPSLDFTSDGPVGHLRSRYTDPTQPNMICKGPSHDPFSPETRSGGTLSEYRALGLR